MEGIQAKGRQNAGGTDGERRTVEPEGLNGAGDLRAGNKRGYRKRQPTVKAFENATLKLSILKSTQNAFIYTFNRRSNGVSSNRGTMRPGAP